MNPGHMHPGWRGAGVLALPPPPLFLLQPLLSRIVRGIARRHPEMFARLGAHRSSRFVIDPVDLPFILYLHPDRERPELRALPRRARPAHDARIASTFFQLLRMIDGKEDGDAMFFSRDLIVSGDTEAIVSLRNAIDDIEGSLASTTANMFGAPGRIALKMLSRGARRKGT